MATLAELQAKKQKALDEAAAIETQIKNEMTKAAENMYQDVIETITEYKDLFSAEQKKAIAALLNLKAKAGRKPRGSGSTKPQNEKKDYILNDGKNTPFTYGGKGRKPDILKHFEESEKGKKLIADGKPTYTLANATKEAPKADPKDSEKGKEPAKA